MRKRMTLEAQYYRDLIGRLPDSTVSVITKRLISTTLSCVASCRTWNMILHSGFADLVLRNTDNTKQKSLIIRSTIKDCEEETSHA